MPKTKSRYLIFALILLAALSLRVGIARFLANDDPDDGKVYSQLARNLLEQRVYSHSTEAPFESSLIRLPGYPLSLAVVYAIFGHGDNTSVRIIQALLDTVTCGLIALIAFYWEPDPARKRAASIAALILAALCPFPAIYVATILTETATTFLTVLLVLTVTYAFRAKAERCVVFWWIASGIVAGFAVLFRPDGALFAAAVGLTLVLTTTFAPHHRTERPDGRFETVLRLSRASYLGAIFTLAFCLVLLPWTIRNWRVFHQFQPLAPVHAEMPGEFVPRGYLFWVRTWLTDERDIAPLIWAVDTLPISLEAFPDDAFDSELERQRVARLLVQYNHPQPNGVPGEIASPLELEEEQSPPEQTTGEESSAGETELELGQEAVEGQVEESQAVAMTPALDAAFAQLARERVKRSPYRYYLKLPLKRAIGLWFNTHSQYYPFEGELFPPEGIRLELGQQVWLPIFMALLWIYTFLAVVGGWFLWRSEEFGARRWFLLTVLIIVLRLGFFSMRENPEPRYVVELFPLLTVLGGIAAVRVVESFKNPGSVVSSGAAGTAN